MTWWKRAVFAIVGAVQRLPGVGPVVHRRVNRLMIERSVSQCRERPHPWSTVHDYISWTSLTDKTWSARHLPAREIPDLPPVDDLVALFARDDSDAVMSDSSSLLFPAFAQYLTDGFIRTRMPSDDDDQSIRLQNTSNHDIDLCTLYGRTAEHVHALRAHDPARPGRLKSQVIDSEEYSPYLYDDDGDGGVAVRAEFAVLDHPLGLSGVGPDQLRHVFAVGGDRVNSVPQVAMINTLLLREHNRLAGEIASAHPDWDDERVFETTRNCVIVMFITIVVEEYINHISPVPLRFAADPSVAWDAKWNKPNWITTEFSLLYRWHSLIPDTVAWNGVQLPVHHTFVNNALLVEGGLVEAFRSMSRQAAGRLGVHNTPLHLLDVERKAIEQGRLARLAPYVDYKAYMDKSGRRPTSFADVSSDPAIQQFLADRYGRVEHIEFYVGLFAEDPDPHSPTPRLLREMVAVDAFSQALTNPLLSKHVMADTTAAFSEIGWATIEATSTLRDVLGRNAPPGTDLTDVSMDL